MRRCCGAVVFLMVLIFPIGVMAFIPTAAAGEFTFAVGTKWQYATLTRTLKVGPDQHRIETPQSDATWMGGVVFNGTYERLFLGAAYASSTFVDSEVPPSQPGVPIFLKDVSLDVSELDLAVGYSIASWLSPYIGYFRHRQQTDAVCVGCIGMIEPRNAGPGVLVHFPLSSLRWAVSLKAALIQGFSLEGGLSYAGIRWPMVGVLGYSYQRIDYPSGKADCSHDTVICFRDHDVFSGPTLAVHYVF